MHPALIAPFPTVLYPDVFRPNEACREAAFARRAAYRQLQIGIGSHLDFILRRDVDDHGGVRSNGDIRLPRFGKSACCVFTDASPATSTRHSSRSPLSSVTVCPFFNIQTSKPI